MNTRLIVPAIVSAVMLATPVLAAESTARVQAKRKIDMTPGQTCASLEKQFDAALKNHGMAAKVEEAKSLRTEGGKLCWNGRPADGIAKLEQAIGDLGVEVNS